MKARGDEAALLVTYARTRALRDLIREGRDAQEVLTRSTWNKKRKSPVNY